MDELILVRPRAEHAEQVMAYKEEMAKTAILSMAAQVWKKQKPMKSGLILIPA